VDVYQQIHVFLISAPVEGKWSVSHSGHFTNGERVPGPLCTGAWVGTTAGLDVIEK
jgi:hypothetical protein